MNEQRKELEIKIIRNHKDNEQGWTLGIVSIAICIILWLFNIEVAAKVFLIVFIICVGVVIGTYIKERDLMKKLEAYM